MYLEDKHPTYEYTVYVQVKSATPYIGVWKGYSMLDVFNHIHEIEEKHTRNNQRFYIDNDFYENKFINGDYVYYYRFMYRRINDWKHLNNSNTNMLVA